MDLVGSLSRHLRSGALDELTLTTNGTQLERHAAELARHGMRRINVSLDTLKPDLFRTLTRGGDCEDYAIAKFVALRRAGIAADDLRIVIMRDTNHGEDHAVAAARLDGRWLTLDNRRFRDLASYAPYEFVEIVFNGETYGGGGIFGQFSTAAADNDWIDYLFVHEFGHHFADLADEYYTSPTSYGPATGEKVEPWMPNVTALHDPANLKWKSRLTPGVAVPTPWPKAEFEEMERGIQARRKQLRADKRPESEMTALFREESGLEHKLFDRSPVRTAVGAFEGGNYEAQGYYRPQMTCMMFDRDSDFCQVCRDAIEEIIDLYSKR
jgi:hypothetical protein